MAYYGEGPTGRPREPRRPVTKWGHVQARFLSKLGRERHPEGEGLGCFKWTSGHLQNASAHRPHWPRALCLAAQQTCGSRGLGAAGAAGHIGLRCWPAQSLLCLIFWVGVVVLLELEGTSGTLEPNSF